MQDFCEEVEEDSWCRPYKAVMSKIKPRGGSVPTSAVFLYRAVQHLFSAHRERRQGIGLTKGDNAVEPPEVTKVEVRTAAN